MPDTLPVLPLRETVLFPLTIAPVSVERSRARPIVDEATAGNRLVALVAIRGAETRAPRPDDLYAFGTASLVHDALLTADDVLRIAVQGVERVRIVGWASTEPRLVAQVEWQADVVDKGPELDALVRAARQRFMRFVSLVTELSSDLARTVDRLTDPRQLVYLLASTTPMTTEARQQLLEQPRVTAKLRRMIAHLEHDIAVRELMRRITRDARSPADGAPRRPPEPPSPGAASDSSGSGNERLELDGLETPPAEPPDLSAQIRALALPEEARKEVDRELDRFERAPTTSPEHSMIRTYLDWVLKLPWNRPTGACIDEQRARDVLDGEHCGLADVKERIIEYLAVRRLRADRGVRDRGDDGDAREPILCLVGPPGVGKTSLGQSIARALSRRFTRVSLGGIHDEAEIRGHRRTYIGAMPGRVLQAIARAGASDPVFMFDEIEKLGVGFHGDPSAALLEVLDGAHNHAFVDSYLGVPFDLSRVLFVCTANTVDSIPAPLLDRMELLLLPGYTDAQKLLIARRHLLPKATRAHGLLPGEVGFEDAALLRIMREYTREAGVRGLSREIGGVLRKTARAVGAGVAVPILVTAGSVQEMLGAPRHCDQAAETIDRPGVATGLAWTPAGGDLLFVEATLLPDEGERLVLTGMLGHTMRESAQAALSYLRSNAERLGLDAHALEHKGVHVHVPAGGVPKDGPSAGVTMFVAMASQASGRTVRSDVAMTGEITLRGRVLAVGGLREKVLAAHRAGMRVVLFPRRSEPQLDDLPAEVRQSLELVPVDSADEVLRLALTAGPGDVCDRSTLPMQEPSRVSVH
jgi:ATP-dependent Lon protease